MESNVDVVRAAEMARLQQVIDEEAKKIADKLKVKGWDINSLNVWAQESQGKTGQDTMIEGTKSSEIDPLIFAAANKVREGAKAEFDYDVLFQKIKEGVHRAF